MNERIHAIESFGQRRIPNITDPPRHPVRLTALYVDRDDLADLRTGRKHRLKNRVHNGDGGCWITYLRPVEQLVKQNLTDGPGRAGDRNGDP